MVDHMLRMFEDFEDRCAGGGWVIIVVVARMRTANYRTNGSCKGGSEVRIRSDCCSGSAESLSE